MTEARLYTTQLQAGLGLIEETRLLLSLYEPGMTRVELTEKALSSGLFPRVSARRLDNIARECFAPRYLRPPSTAVALKRLAETLHRDEFSQLLLIHTARANRILADFIREVYWPLYSAGRDLLSLDDARDFIIEAVRAGKTQKPWSASTIRRMSTYLIICCADYGLLTANVRGPRKIEPFRIQPKTVAYLAYDLKFLALGDNQIIGHPDWQLFGLSRDDVRDQLKRLSLQGLLILQSAADVTQISWTHKNMEEVIDVLAQS